MLKAIHFKEFFPYFIIGGMATCIDWSLYWFLVHILQLHYEPALIIGYICAGLFHYTCNKFFTFRCQSKQIGAQYSLHIIVSGTTLLLSMLIIATFINLFSINKMTARIITTIVMLIPNYLLHKHITFSKKYFLETKS